MITALSRSDKTWPAAHQRADTDRANAFKDQTPIRIPKTTTDSNAVSAQDPSMA
ncbi:hypothetical protein ABZY31_21810 [Streptomyces sp. NPDC006529]|uniref:hypothetical protein n=1 Tax=Streptomyces sp. NPDC006529 TaxID=3157177 RepID=UPI0033B46D05